VDDLPGDHARVRELLGREPRGRYEVAVRNSDGAPVVLRNAPFLDDGTPMPTTYWLVDPDENRRIGQLEAAGGVDAAESAVDADELAAAHARYAAERDSLIPADHRGPRPSGGVGGTRTGVKCLHAHWAWHLAGGDDPVGRWIAQRLDEGANPSAGPSAPWDLHVDAHVTTLRLADGTAADLPWGAANLSERWLSDTDPPRPEDLTNALGTVADELDDIIRVHPDVLDLTTLRCTGPAMRSIAAVEVGDSVLPDVVPLAKPDAEEIFRMLATESSRDRADNPGLASDDVETVVAACCILLAFVRRLHLDEVTLHPVPSGGDPASSSPG
jgi:hypothetical protein